MNTRMIVLTIIIILLLFVSGAIASAHTGQMGADIPYRVEISLASGNGYHLTPLTWRVEGAVSGGSYLLAVSAPELNGSGCCCSYLPCISK
jgi:hypothetical protein